MNGIINLNTYACDCCGKEFEESEMVLMDCELVCVECVESDEYSEYEEHTNDSRLTLIERNS